MKSWGGQLTLHQFGLPPKDAVRELGVLGDYDGRRLVVRSASDAGGTVEAERGNGS